MASQGNDTASPPDGVYTIQTDTILLGQKLPKPSLSPPSSTPTSREQECLVFTVFGKCWATGRATHYDRCSFVWEQPHFLHKDLTGETRT